MVVLVGTARSDINQEPIHRGRDQNPSTVSQQSRSSGAAGGGLPLNCLAHNFPQITSLIYKILRYQLRNQWNRIFFLSQGSGQFLQR